MSDSISIGCAENAFDRLSSRLDEAADQLDAASAARRAGVAQSLRRAAEHATDSVLHVAGAAANGALAAAKTAQGLARHGESAARLTAAGGLAVAGAAARTVEEVAGSARTVARAAARGFAALANGLSRLVGDGASVTVRELEADPSDRRVSDRLFAAAGRQLDQAAAARSAGWNAWAEAVAHLAGSAVNAGLAARHARAAAVNVATAANSNASAAALEAGALGARLSSAAVQAAEEGVKDARSLAVLSARLSAGTANAPALSGQGRVEIRVRVELEACQLELRRAVAQEPGLRALAAGYGLCGAAR